MRSPYVDLKKRQDEIASRRRKNKSETLSEEEEKIANAGPYPWVRDDAKETTEWKEITRWNASDVFIPVSAAGHAFAFANEGKSVLVLTSANATAVRLVQLSAGSGRLEKVLAAGDKGKGEVLFVELIFFVRTRLPQRGNVDRKKNSPPLRKKKQKT